MFQPPTHVRWPGLMLVQRSGREHRSPRQPNEALCDKISTCSAGLASEVVLIGFGPEVWVVVGVGVGVAGGE